MLLSDKAVVRKLSALMLAHGVTRCVLCPGSRNAPLTATFDALFECRTATDERSAGFMALGWAAQCGQPVAVCVTTGSAVLNVHPAVAEAYYRHLPLLVISADRPAAWIGQQDGQTLPQQGVFGTLVRFAAQVPEADAWHANRLINEGLLALRRNGGGPVHFNLPLSEPFFSMSEGELPRERVIRHTLFGTDALPDLAPYQKILVVMGQTANDFPADIPFLHSVPVTGDHLGAARLYAPDQLPPDAALCRLTEAEEADLIPDLLITLGGSLVPKQLKQLFRRRQPREHWHISAAGEASDTFCCLTRVIEGEPAAVLRQFEAPADLSPAFADRWHKLLSCPVAVPHGFNALTVVRDTLAALPEQAVLHLANSSAVRYAELFPLPAGIAVQCNRGVNGIEGSLSAAVGYAAGDTRFNLLIIGDLSFFYDMNALWLPALPANLRILLLNNGGGAIFHALQGIPQAAAVSAPHHAAAAAWAQSCGIQVHSVATAQEWQTALPALLTAATAAPVLVEVHTDSHSDAAAYRQALRGGNTF